MKSGLSVTVVFVGFLIVVQGKIKSSDWGTEGNRAIAALLFGISGETPDLGRAVRIPTEVVIPNIIETVHVGRSFRPFLTQDPINRGVGVSLVGAA